MSRGRAKLETGSTQKRQASEADVQGSRAAPAKRPPVSKSSSSDHHSRRAHNGTAGGSPSPHITGRDFRQLVHNYAHGRASLKDKSSVWLLVGRGYGRVRGLVSRSVQKERLSREQNWKLEAHKSDKLQRIRANLLHKCYTACAGSRGSRYTFQTDPSFSPRTALRPVGTVRETTTKLTTMNWKHSERRRREACDTR
jgi:hypothetical protein